MAPGAEHDTARPARQRRVQQPRLPDPSRALNHQYGRFPFGKPGQYLVDDP
ncbi:hypothetical protein Msi02_09110 [Microbispora siamensis]|uniref:Uncharacterized protein n=1 Tax=Microbispora siamensis TaxID=564413 RepID=A0ABQ4GF92_9ACTN|nr:hypothetical protein Msi02_09110 [Microbispora siamensis]